MMQQVNFTPTILDHVELCSFINAYTILDHAELCYFFDTYEMKHFLLDNHEETSKDLYTNLSGVPVIQRQIQVQRQNDLHSFCNSFIANNSNYRKALLYNKVKSKPLHPATWLPWRHFLYSDTHKALYCYIPKIACTNWKWIMHVLENAQLDSLRLISRNKIHHLKYNTVKNNSHYEQKKKYFTFLFVRHPFGRLISAYRNKILKPYPDDLYHVNTTNKNILLRYRKNFTTTQDLATRATFEEFVRYLIDSYEEDGIRNFDEHWGSYAELCNICYAKFDYIGKYESLIDDSHNIITLLDVTDFIKFPENRTDKYKKKSDQLVEEYFKTVSRKYIVKLYEVYKYDFEAFGYNISSLI